MGVKKFSEFKDELKFELGRPNDTSLDSYTGGWINTAYIQLTTRNKFWTINKRFYFPELEVSTSDDTTDGQAYIDVPSGCLVIRTLWDSTSDIKLTKISWLDYVNKTGRADSSSEGAPTKWCRQGDYIYLNPTPDGTYTIYIYYRKIPTLLSANDDTTAIGTEWDEPILQLAVMQSHMRLGEFDKAEVKKKEWLETVGSLVGVYEQEKFDREDIRKPSIAYLDYKY